jgi:hypothetical protein
LTYNADTGAPGSLVVDNTSTRACTVDLYINGTLNAVNVKQGSHTYSAANMRSWGLTNVNTQIDSVSVVSP